MKVRRSASLTAIVAVWGLPDRLLGALLCRFGRHDWGGWSPWRPAGGSGDWHVLKRRQRRCKRCAAENTVLHGDGAEGVAALTRHLARTTPPARE